MLRSTLITLGGLIFCLLILLNVGGYRYGVSDQAFYIPVVKQGLNPSLFPHDADLLAAQNQFFAFDNWFAPLIELSGLTLPDAFLATYFIGLLILYGAVVAIGRSLYQSWWCVAALSVALTIRHRIPDTAVNTLEAYLHPRQLAFALGMVGVAVFLRGKTWLAIGTVVGAMLLHPTTAIWFAVLIGIGALVSDRESRQPILAIAGAGASAAVVLLVSTLREQIVVMNPSWTALLQTKDYLQATDWPMLTWFANLSFAAIVAAVYDYRRTLNLATPRETGLVAGCAALLILFLLSVPLAHSGVALIVQLQFSRIFWLLDVIAIAYAVWVVIESPLGTKKKLPRLQIRHAGVALLFLVAITRGIYVTHFERPTHPLVEIDLPKTEWTAVMKWAEQKPIGTHFLVDPGHAWRYGSSVRAASGRDVYLEEIKDIGIAIYSDDIADRVSNRITELGDFSQLDPSRAKRLARRYHIDYLITEHPIELPLIHEQGSFLVYDLRTDVRFAQRAGTFQ